MTQVPLCASVYIVANMRLAQVKVGFVAERVADVVADILAENAATHDFNRGNMMI